jgi:hypothetical protein
MIFAKIIASSTVDFFFWQSVFVNKGFCSMVYKFYLLKQLAQWDGIHQSVLMLHELTEIVLKFCIMTKIVCQWTREDHLFILFSTIKYMFRHVLFFIAGKEDNLVFYSQGW